jgi:hypothetical protein
LPSRAKHSKVLGARGPDGRLSASHWRSGGGAMSIPRIFCIHETGPEYNRALLDG